MSNSENTSRDPGGITMTTTRVRRRTTRLLMRRTRLKNLKAIKLTRMTRRKRILSLKRKWTINRRRRKKRILRRRRTTPKMRKKLRKMKKKKVTRRTDLWAKTGSSLSRMSSYQTTSKSIARKDYTSQWLSQETTLIRIRLSFGSKVDLVAPRCSACSLRMAPTTSNIRALASLNASSSSTTNILGTTMLMCSISINPLELASRRSKAGGTTVGMSMVSPTTFTYS